MYVVDVFSCQPDVLWCLDSLEARLYSVGPCTIKQWVGISGFYCLLPRVHSRKSNDQTIFKLSQLTESADGLRLCMTC